MAKDPPTIEFGLVDTNRYGSNFGNWGNAVLGPDGKYYFCLGNHDRTDGGTDDSLLVSYDPESKKHEILLYSKDLFGPAGEGKWHGRPDINPDNGDMYLIGFYHGHVVYYNIYTRKAADLGAPVPGKGWPEHIWDWRRDRLYGVGDPVQNTGGVLVYDTKNKATVFQGIPADSQTGKPIDWYGRARLLDRETGALYGSTSSSPYNIVKYDPAANRFTRMKSTLASRLRAWTDRKEKDGSFWVIGEGGDIYRFYPEQDRVEYKGKNWGTNGFYTASLERSPDGRYLYYSLSNDAYKEGLPIIQYDTQTNQKKVIAFLASFYASQRNYVVSKIYGAALSADGSSYFVTCNGKTTSGMRMQAMFNVHIPLSER